LAIARHNKAGTDRNLTNRVRGIGAVVAVCGEQCRKGRIVGIICGDEFLAVGRQSHLINPQGATGGDRRHNGVRSGLIEIDDLERAVAVTGIKPPAMGGNAIRSGFSVVHGRG
jgi:hypothetical protein